MTSPTNGSTVASPVRLSAKAYSSRTVTGWRVYVDSVGVYKSGAGSTISTNLPMTAGTHKITVRAWNSSGYSGSASLGVTVPSTTGSVAVAISPTSAVLQAGLSQQFSANVSGTTNTSVNWLVNGVLGGSSTVGTISSTGLYKAPATVPYGGSVTVSARSMADTTRSASAAVTISATPATVSVSISPTSTSVQTNQTKQFAATVSGTTNTSIAWLVNGTQGGNSQVGTISSSGLYTAPAIVPSGGSVSVTARSVYDSAKSAYAAVSITGLSAAKELYVSPTGSDSNSCTSSAPCRSINRADALAIPGTIVHVAAGNYTGPWRATHSGTASAPIIFVSDTKWGAKVSATGLGSGSTFRNDGSYVEIRGFQVTGDGADGILNNGSYVTIDGNWVHHITDAPCYGGGGIHSWGNHSIRNVTFINNKIHDIGNPDSSSPCDQVHGIYEENRYGKILNNVVYRSSGWGIHLWHAASDAVVANNTSFANRQSGIVIGGGDSGVTTGVNNTATFNNILYKNSEYGITQQGVYGPNNTFKNNLIYGNGWGAVSGLTDSGRISAEPMFVYYSPTGSGDYRLQSGSPAVDTGLGSTTAGTTNASAPNEDCVGTPRPSGRATDIGAYEQ